MEILSHHCNTYEELSRQDGTPEQLAEKQVLNHQSIPSYKLDNLSNKAQREEAIAKVIQAFRDGEVKIIEDSIGVMDIICESCAVDDCSAKPTSPSSENNLFGRIKNLIS